MDPKLLTESGWKTTAQKFKVKDNGLQRALASYENLEDDQHDERLSKIGSVSQLAGSLKKDKAVAANPAVVKYLADVLSAAEAKQQELAKAKLMAAKTEAMTRKKAETEAKNRDPQEEEEEEEQGAYHVKLMAAFQKLKGSKDLSYQFIICDAKPHC